MDLINGETTAPQLCKIDPEKEIRILELLPTNSTSPFQGRLIVRKLYPNTASKRTKQGGIPYHALSYAWGPLAPRYPFVIDNGVVLHLTFNLWRALQCLRSSLKRQYIWADQICIDQDNITERNHQVKLMAEVYRQAKEVLIWLGEAPMTTAEKVRLHLPDHGRLAERLMNKAQKAATTQWATRGWVVQEALLARKLPLLCINDVRIRYCVSAKRLELPGRYPPVVLAVLRLLSSRRELDRSEGLVAFGKTMSRTDTHDPRDKIYSILALMEEGLRRLIEPDYTATNVSVFTQATAAHMLLYRDLSIITLAVPQTNREDHDRAWPSWVPNYANLEYWRCQFAQAHWPLFRGSMGWCRRQACRESVIEFDPFKATLAVRGLEFDYIVASMTLGLHEVRDLYAKRRRSKAIQAESGEPALDPCPYDTLLQRDSVCLSVAEDFWQSYFEDLREGERGRPWGPNDRVRWSVWDRMSHWLGSIFQEWTALCREKGFKLDQPRTGRDIEAELEQWSMHLSGLDVFLTARRFLGFGLSPLKTNTRIALLYGTTLPIALSPISDTAENGEGVEASHWWEAVRSQGYVYVHGIMHDELNQMPDFELPERNFNLF